MYILSILKDLSIIETVSRYLLLNQSLIFFVLAYILLEELPEVLLILRSFRPFLSFKGG